MLCIWCYLCTKLQGCTGVSLRLSPKRDVVNNQQQAHLMLGTCPWSPQPAAQHSCVKQVGLGWYNVQQVLVLLQLEVMSVKRAGVHIGLPAAGQRQPELWHSFCALLEGCRNLIFAFVSSVAGSGLFLDASLASIL